MTTGSVDRSNGYKRRSTPPPRREANSAAIQRVLVRGFGVRETGQRGVVCGEHRRAASLEAQAPLRGPRRRSLPSLRRTENGTALPRHGAPSLPDDPWKRSDGSEGIGLGPRVSRSGRTLGTTPETSSVLGHRRPTTAAKRVTTSRARATYRIRRPASPSSPVASA